MSNALKIENNNQEEVTKTDVTESAAAKESAPVSNTDILEFSITSQIKNIDLSKLGDVPSEQTATHTNVVQLPTQKIGDTTHTQILEIAKASNEVDVLEAQVKLIALFVSEARILEAELNKYIHAVHKQSPQSKKYLLQMKKVIKDFSDIEKILEKAKSVK